MRLSPLAFVKHWLVVVLLSLVVAIPAYSQSNVVAAGNVPPTNYDAGYAVQYIRHESDNQNQIIVPVTPALTTAVTCVGAACGTVAGPTGPWIVRINGTATAITSVTGAVGATQITINLTGATPVIKVGNAVTVSYTGSAALNAFTNRTSYNARPIVCSDFTFSGWFDGSASCAPVTPNSQMVFSVLPGARNSQRWSIALTSSRVLWNSPATTPATGLQGVETNSGGTATANTYFVGFSTSNPLVPPAYTYPASDPVCGYTSAWNVRLTYTSTNGFSGNCPLTHPSQNQAFASYNNDETGISGSTATTADVLLPPTTVNSNRVCLGNNVNMTFTDGTRLNCNPAVAPAPVNDKVRWVRVVYGSTDMGPGNTANDNIPNITVAGVPVTNASGALLYAGGYSPTTTSYGTPDAFGVVKLTVPVTGPRGVLDLIQTSSPTGQAVGQRFYVRIDYWNSCNPYDDANDALNLRKSIENYIEIVTIPPAPSAVTQAAVCNGTTPSNFGITGAANNSTVNWYAAASGGSPIATNTADGAGAASLPITSAPGWVNANTAGIYTVYASYISSPAGINCESPRTAVTRTIREKLDLAAANLAIGTTTAVCAGTNNVVYTVKAANGTGAATNAATQTIGGATEYVWTLPTGYTLASGSLNGTSASITVNIASNATTQNISVAWRYTTGLPCDLPPITRSQTVNPLPVITAPAGITVCDGTVVAATTPTTSIASTYSWTSTAGTGTVTGFSDGTNAANFSQGGLGNTSHATAATRVYAVVPRTITTVCTGAPFNITVTVNPSPVITSYTGTAVCSDALVSQNFRASDAGSVATAFYDVSNFTVVALNGATVVSGTPTGANKVSTDLANDIFNNVGNSVANVAYTVSPKTSVANGSCSGAPFTLTMPINPEPVMGSQTLIRCSKEALTGIVYNGGTAGNTVTIGSYDVSIAIPAGVTAAAGSPGTGGTGQAANAISDDAWKNVNTTNSNVVYTVTPRASGTNCAGNSFTITVTVRPEPVVAAQNITICSDVALGVNFNGSSNSQTVNTYTINSRVLSAGVTGPNGTGSGFLAGDLADDVYTKLTSGNGTVTYNVTPVGTCTGDPFVVTVTVRPEPVVPNMNPAAICSDVLFGNPFSSSTNGVSADSYKITAMTATSLTPGSNVAVTFPTTGAANILNDDGFTNISGAQQNATYTVTPIHAYTGPAQSCEGDPFTLTIPVNSGPAVANQPIATPLCSGVAVGVNFNSSTNGVAANTYEIVNRVNTGLTPGGTVEAIGATGLAATALSNDTFTNTGTADGTVTYTVRPRNTANGCAGPTFTVTLTVRPEPVVNNQTATICSDAAVAANFNSGTNITATTYNVTSIDNPAGLASANVVTGDQTISGLANDSWTNLTSINRTVTYHVLPRSVNNCVGAEFTVTLTIRPEPVGVTEPASPICSGQSVNYNLQTDNVTQNGNGVASSFEWVAAADIPGVTGESMAAHFTTTIDDILVNTSGADATVTYNVIPTATTGTCVGTQFQVTVLVRGPKVTIDNGATLDICADGNIPLLVTETYTSGSFTTRAWTATRNGVGVTAGNVFSNPAIAQPIFTPTPSGVPLAGTYVLTYTATSADGCSATASMTVNVTNVSAAIKHGPVTANLTTLNETVCNATNVILDGNPSGGSGVYNLHTWSVASSTPIAVAITDVMTAGAAATRTPTFNYNNTTSAPVTIVLRYYVRDNQNCDFTTGAGTDLSITVNPTPTVTDPIDQTWCTGQMTTAVNFSAAPNNVAGTFFEWTNTNTAIGLAASGTGNIGSFATTNTTAGVISGTVTVTPKFTNNGVTCAGTPQTFTITVNPKPVIGNVSAATIGDICSGNAFSVTLTNNPPTTIIPANTTYTWVVTSNPGGVSATAQIAGVTTIGQTLTNPTNTMQTVVYTVTPTSGAAGNCPGNDFTVTVNVKPRPNIDNRTLNICSGTGAFTASLVNGINGSGAADASIIIPAGTQYDWGVPTISPGVAADVTGEGAATNQTSVSQTLTNLTNVPQTLTYTVTAHAGTSPTCTANSNFTVTVRLDPRPAIDNRTTTICSGNAFTISPVNGINNAGAAAATVIVPTNTTYTWTVTNVTPGGVSAITGEADQATPQTNISQTLTNVTSVAQTVRYTVTPTSGALGACTGSTFFVDVTVSPRPLIGNQTPPTICSGTAFTTTLVNNPPTTIIPTGTTYTWTIFSNPGGLNATAQGTGVAGVTQTLTNPTNTQQIVVYRVTPTAGSCAGPTFDVTVTVDPKPAIPNQTVEVCSASLATFTITNGTPAGTIYPAGTTFTWSLPTTSGGLTGMSTGTDLATFEQTLTNTTTAIQTADYVVTPKAGSCTGATFNVHLIIDPIPSLSSDLFPDDICSSVFNYTPTSATSGAQWTWTRAVVPGISESASQSAGYPTPGSGVISEPLTNTFTTPIDVEYVFTTFANGCQRTESVVVRVNPTPIANPIGGPATVCAGTGNTFFYNVTQNSGSTYSWEVPSQFTVAAAGGGATPGGGPGPFSADYFILLRFNTATTQTLRVYEKSADGCVGLANEFPISVSNAAPTGTISGLTTVCKQQTGVVYQVSQNPSSNFIWSATGATIVGPTAGTNLYQIVVDFGPSPSATLNVTEINTAGCPTIYPALPISAVDAPVMSGPFSGSICSGQQPSSVITLATSPVVASNFNWFVKSVTANITGTFLNEIGSGPLSHAVPLKNISGTDGTIVYRVTPTATAAPFCIGLPVDYTVTIKPEPVVAVIPDQNFCGLATVDGSTFPFTSNVSGAQIDWSATNFAAIGLSLGTGSGNMLFNAADNLTGANITSVVTVTATANSCTSTGANLKTFNLNIKPRPVVDVIPNVVVCSGGSISSIAFTANTGGSESFSWTNSNPAIGLAASGTVNIPGYTAPVNTTNLPFVGTITVRANKNSCDGPDRTFTITVNPQPVVSSTLDRPVCSQGATGLTLATAGTSVAASSYNIVSRTISGGLSTITAAAVPATGVATGYLAADQFKNTTNGPLTVQYVVEAVQTSFGTCIGATRTITVTVNPEPVVSTSLDRSVCSNDATGLVLNTNGVSIGAGVYDIISVTPDPGLSVVVSAGAATNVAANFLANDKFRNLTNGSLPVVYVVQPKVSAAGCVGETRSITVTVDPEPVLDPGLNDNVCSGDVIGLNLGVAGTSVGASSYRIISRTLSSGSLTVISAATVPANGVVSNYLSNDKFENLTASALTVTYKVQPVGATNSCLGAQVDVVITIDPQPVIASGLDKSVCSGDDVALNLSLAGTSVGATGYNFVSRTVPGGLTVNTSAAVPSTNQAANFVATDNFTNTTGAALNVVYVVQAVGSLNNCIGPQKSITVTINPEPVIASNLDGTVCSQAAIGLNLAVAPTSVSATGYNIISKNVPGGLTPIVAAAVPATNKTANYLAADKYRNTTGGSLIVEYEVEAIGSVGTNCVGASRIIQITVDPEPVMASGLSANVCSDAPVNLMLATAPGIGAANYNIVSRTIQSGLSAITTVTVPANTVAANYLQTEVYQNTTNSAKTVTYQVVPVGTINGCLGQPATITMTIFPEPVVATGLDATKCSGTQIGLMLATSGTSVTASGYNILNRTIAAGLTQTGAAAAIPGNNVGATYLQNETFTNYTSGPLTVTYDVEAISSLTPACTGAVRTITMTINPEPVLSTTLDNAICSGAATGLILSTEATSVSAINYNILSRTSTGLTAVGTPAVVPASNKSSIYLSADRFENTTNGPLDIVYEIQPIGAINSCPGATVFVTITVNPQPVVAANLNKTVCSDDEVGLILNTAPTSSAALGYNVINRIVQTGLTPITQVSAPASNVADDYFEHEVYTNTTATARTVQYIVTAVNGCEGAQRTITVTINPEPVVATNLDASICSGQALGLTLNTTATSVTAANYNIVSVTVAPGLTQVGTPAVVPATGVANNYLAAETFRNLTANPLTVTYDVTALGSIGTGCVGDVRTITMTINPEPVVSTTLDKTVCSDIATGLLLDVELGSASALNYNIISRVVAAGLSPVAQATIPGGGANGVAANYLANEKYTNTTGGSLTVEYLVRAKGILGNCLSDTRLITVTIDPKPVIPNLDATICSDEVVGLVFNTNGTSVAALNYNVISRTVATGLTPVTQVTVPATTVADNYVAAERYINTTNGDLTVKYMVSANGTINACAGDPKEITITIKPQPVIAINLDAAVCGGSPVGLVLNTNGTSVSAGSYNIISRTVAAGLAPVTQVSVPGGGITGVANNYLAGEVYDNFTAGALTVQYEVAAVGNPGNCTGPSRIITITINPKPVVSPTLNQPVCSDVATGLILNTDGVGVGALNYNIVSRTVAPGLVAVTQANIPGGGANGVAANYLVNEKYTNTTNGSLTVEYRVRARGIIGNCLGDERIIIITIDPEPVIASNLDDVKCSDEPVGLVLATQASSIAALNYNIISRTVGTGLIPVTQATVPASNVANNYLQAEVYTNPTAGALTVQYVVQATGTINGCLGDNKTITITINPEPVISTTLDATVCSEQSVGLTLNTNGTSIGAINYDVVSRTVAPGLTPVPATQQPIPGAGVAAGYLTNEKYTNITSAPLTVQYIVQAHGASGNCLGDPRTITITINPEPVVSSTLNTSACSDVATGLTLDTEPSSVTALTYNIISRTVDAGLTPVTQAVVPGGGITGVSATYLANEKYNNVTSGSLNVTYVVSARGSVGNCVGKTRTIVIQIDPEPVISNSLDNFVCSNQDVNLTLNTNGTSVAAADYNILSRTVSGGLTPLTQATVPAAGVPDNYLVTERYKNTTNISLTVQYVVEATGTINGCAGNQKTITMTIYPEPVVASTLNKTVCSDAPIALNLAVAPTSVPAASYNIVSRTLAPGLIPVTTAAIANGQTAAYLANDKFTNLTTGPLDVTYVVTANGTINNCTGDQRTIIVTINPEPIGDLIVNVPVCSDEPIGAGYTLSASTGVAAVSYNITISTPPGLTASGGVTSGNGKSATELIDDKWNNQGLSPLDVSYHVTPVSADGCAGDEFVVTVTIRPEPVGTPISTIVACSNAPIGAHYLLTSSAASVAASTYNIIVNSRGLVNTATDSQGNGMNANELVDDVWINTGLLPVDVDYLITPVSAANCLGDPYTVKVTVSPEPIGMPITTTRCSDEVFGAALFLASSGTSVPASTFKVTVNADPGLVFSGATPSGGAGKPASILTDDKWNNITNGPLDVLYSIIPVSGGNCEGASFDVRVTINPEPIGAPDAALEVCSGEVLNFDLQTIIDDTYPGNNLVAGNGVLSKFKYSVTSSPAAAGVSPGANRNTPSQAAITDTYVNLSNLDATITYTVTPYSVAGDCEGTPFDFKVIVHPEPKGSLFNDPVCSTVLNHDLQSQITNGVIARFSYTVSSDDEAAVPTPAGLDRAVASTAPITDTFLNTSGHAVTVTYEVTPFNDAHQGCAGDIFYYNVVISPKPQAANRTLADVCSNVPFTYNPQDAVDDTSTTPPGNGVASTFTWSVAYDPGLSVVSAGTGNGVISETLANRTSGNTTLFATYTVTPKAGTCTGNFFTIRVPINPEPIVATTLNEVKCSGDVYGKLLNTNGVSTPAVSYNVTVVSVDAGLTGGRPIGLIGGGSSPDNILASDSYINLTATPLKVVYSIVANGASCSGPARLVEFTINPEPVLIDPAAPDICSRDITNIVLSTNGSSVGATTYRLSAPKRYRLASGTFSTSLPAGFTEDTGNAGVGVNPTTGGINLIKGDKYTNTAMEAVIVEYTITPKAPAASGACDGDPVTFVITVNPEPTLDPLLSPTAICSGETIEGGTALPFELRSIAGSVTATSFILRGVVSQSGLVPGPSNATLGAGKNKDALDNDSWINPTGGMLTVTYTVAPVAGTCVGPDQTFTVDINPAPAMASGLDRIVCSGAASGIAFADNAPASAPAGSFDIIAVEIEAPGPDPAITPGGTTLGLTANAANAPLGITTLTSRIAADRYINTTNDRIVVIYRVVPIAPAGMNSCRGQEVSIRLTVEPQIVSASVNAAPTICSGDAVNITLESPTYSNGAPTNPLVVFNYSMASVTGIFGATTGNSKAETFVINDVLINTTATDVTVDYKITAIAATAANGLGCSSVDEHVIVVVRPLPKVNNVPSKTICSGESTNISLSSPTYPGTPSNIEFSVRVLSADAGITGFTAGTFVKANPSSIADVLTNTSSMTGKVTYEITPRSIAAVGSCVNATPMVVDVTVSPKPVITPIPNFAICSGDSFDPIAIVTDTETAMPGSTLITWTATPNPNVSGESNGAGNSFSQVLFNSTADKQVVIYNISATNINSSPSCLATPPTELRVTVYPNPKLVGLPSSANVCNNGTLSPNPYVLTPSTVAALGTTFDWTVDNGGNPDLPAIANGVNQTAITQTFVNNGPFLGTQQYTITAHLNMAPGDNPLIDTQITDAVCTAQQDGVIVVNVAPAVNGDIYGFDIEGNQATDIYLCRGAKQFVYIDPVGLPLMDVTYSENGTTKTLSKLGGLNVLQVSPANTTTYQLLTVKDKFGCVQTINKTVTVHVDEVDNTFSLVGPAIACSPFPVTFQHNQVAGTSYTWKWLDGPDSTTYLAGANEAGKHIKHIYTNPSPGSTAKFRASLDAFLDTTRYLAGCRKKPVVVEVKVYPTISTAVFPDKDVICSDESVAFVNSSQGVSATGHRWFYRVSGSTTELDVKTTPNVTFKIPNTTTSNPLVYEVVYQATNGNCPAPEVITPITVYRGVDAHFAHTVPTLFVGGHSFVDFTNDSQPVDADDFRYEWDFGLDAHPTPVDPIGPGPFKLDYSSPGPKEVKVVATNMLAEAAGLTCLDQYTEIINIAVPPLIADFTAVPLEACFPTDITITENKATGDKYAWRVLDNAGTAGQSNAVLPVFKVPSPGKYTIELTTTNSYTGDQKTATKDVIIYNLPMASFDMRPGVVYVPDTEVLTYNFSDGATSYAWDFGDGSTSDEKEPTYKYRIEGVYDVTLIAMNDHGNGVVCTDTLTRKITAKQGGVTRVPNAFTPNPNGPTSSAGTPGVPGSNTFNDVFLPQVKGAEEFNMQIFDRWGNLIFESNNSNVGWDGYDRHGRLMPMGVYVYKLTLRLSDGQRTTQVGDITMIR